MQEEAVRIIKRNEVMRSQDGRVLAMQRTRGLVRREMPGEKRAGLRRWKSD